MKKIIYLFSLILFFSCGGKGVEGNVGQIISISAEENLEESDVDYNWIIVSQPDGSLLSPKDLKYKNNAQEMIFIPDYPGDYNFEVSITKFGDELSMQSFFFTISDLLFTKKVSGTPKAPKDIDTSPFGSVKIIE